MAAMADRLDDLICIHDPTGSAMETLTILLLGWIIFGTILTVVGKFLYSRLLLDAGPKNASSSSSVAGTPSLNSTAPPMSSSSSQPTAAASPESNKPVTNTERFINTLKQNPPPAPPTKLVRSKSTNRSVDQLNHHPDVPAVAGSNADCVKWVTASLNYIYARTNILSDLTGSWKESLNGLTKRSEIETGVAVEIQRVIFQEEHIPRINNVFCEITPNEKASVTGDFEARFTLLIRVCREQRDHQSISDYRLLAERLRGRLNVSLDLHETSTALLKFDGWPDIRLIVVSKEEPRTPNNPSLTEVTTNDEQLLLDIILEMVTSALRSASTQLFMGRYADFPRFTPSVNPAEPILPVHYDSMLETRLRRSAKDKKLLVKVVKANNIGSEKGCHQLHAIIEMDDPPQRHQTTVKQATENPFWDENFLFDLSPNTEEILFEIYDRDKVHNVFLGLGIVSMEELLMNPSQRQIIPLQSRPYENDSVSGTLTAEFLFIDNMDGPSNLPANVMSANKTSNAVDAEGRIMRRDSYHRATKRPSDLALPSITDDNKLGAGSQLSLSAVHLGQSSPRRNGNHDVDNGDRYKDPYCTDLNMTPGMNSLASSLSSKEEEHARSRPRNKRNFFRTIKERLSRSTNRSRSVDPGTTDDRDDSLNREGDPLVRSVSVDRARSGQQLLAVPCPTGSNLADSSRSSLSEMSVVSNASTRTYLDEASTLVLEATENGIKKHYLIPMAMAEKRKWKKKGTKLHIFSDHVFVAKHLPGGTVCQVCAMALARRPGKQGYECRDCLFRCHKPCHVKVESLCPSSTVHFMELEFVEDTVTGKMPRRL